MSDTPTEQILAPEQIDAAYRLAEKRAKYWAHRARAAQNPFDSQLVGALGEYGVLYWADRSGFLPIDPAFLDGKRQGEADLILGPGNTRIEVKSCQFGDRFVFPNEQVSGLGAKADLVLWTEVHSNTEGWESKPVSCRILLLGWSTADEVMAVQPGADGKLRVGGIRSIASLLAILCPVVPMQPSGA